MTAEKLANMLEHMYEETKEGRIHWQLEVMTSEFKDASDKPVVEADGQLWTVDECYADYHCTYQNIEFSVITYENIETAGEQVRSTNMVFLPPLSVRRFDLDYLAPYAVEATAPLVAVIRKLWELLLVQKREHPELVEVKANE